MGTSGVFLLPGGPTRCVGGCVGGFAHPIPKQRPRGSQQFPRDTNWTSTLSVPDGTLVHVIVGEEEQDKLFALQGILDEED